MKKQEVEVKEKRKQDRELKWKKTAEELKQEAELRACKALEPQALKDKKDLKKAEKLSNVAKKKPEQNQNRKWRNMHHDDWQLKQLKNSGQETDLCCACFGSFQDDKIAGRVWDHVVLLQ